MMDLTSGSAEILTWVIGGLTLAFVSFRFSQFLNLLMVRFYRSVRGKE